jgi:hypothetical protein
MEHEVCHLVEGNEIVKGISSLFEGGEDSQHAVVCSSALYLLEILAADPVCRVLCGTVHNGCRPIKRSTVVPRHHARLEELGWLR